VGAAAAGKDVSVDLTAISAISAMVVPVVLITTGGILSNGLLAMYGAVNDRMRDMDHERWQLLTAPSGSLLTLAQVPGSDRERLSEIDRQLPMLLRRHGLLHYAVLLIICALVLLVLSVIAIAVAVTGQSSGFATAALALVLAGTAVILVALLYTARSLAISRNAVKYEVSRALALGSPERVH
jgi:hypothetical protein